MAANKNGRLGEDAAAEYLLNNGFEIAERNYKSRYGEIDIIAIDRNYILFVEVKTRFENSLYLPREAVDIRKQRKIIKTAEMYLSENEAGSLQPRFDVVEVTVLKQKEFKIKSINLIKNAFTL